MKKLLAVLLFLVLQAFFFQGILFEPGIIIGSDWSLPLTQLQVRTFGEQGFYTWVNNLLGARKEKLVIQSLPVYYLR